MSDSRGNAIFPVISGPEAAAVVFGHSACLWYGRGAINRLQGLGDNMRLTQIRQLLIVDNDYLLEHLSRLQHLSPHLSLGQAMKKLGQTSGIPLDVFARAADWLGLNSQRSLGRLRRSEIAQLAKSTHRFWRQNTSSVECPAQPVV